MFIRPLASSLGIMVLLAANAFGADFSSLPDATKIVPPSFVKSVSLPLLGEIWADATHPNTGQSYCVYQGKVLCVLYAFSEKELAKGTSWYALPGLKNLPPVDHIEFQYQGKGFGTGQPPRHELAIYFVSEHDLSDVRP